MTSYALLYYNVYDTIKRYIYIYNIIILIYSPRREYFFIDEKVIGSRLQNFKKQKGIDYRELTPRGKK